MMHKNKNLTELKSSSPSTFLTADRLYYRSVTVYTIAMQYLSTLFYTVLDYMIIQRKWP